MAVGLAALLDDIAALAKITAASVDDIATGAIKASSKSVGVIIDDAAVTPQYVTGISPKRELNVIWKIAQGSLVNKFLFIIPIAMVLTFFAPFLLPYLLILGGAYLSFEGAEKVIEWVSKREHSPENHQVSDTVSEKSIVRSATRTDLILSTEIMLIALSNINATEWWKQLGMLIVVGLVMTALVYGTVALLIKVDDVGLWMAKKDSPSMVKTGTALVKGMPYVFKVIGVVGTIAMLWVGGHILVKSVSDAGFHPPYDFFHLVTHSIEHLGSVVVWLTDTTMSAVAGVLIGLVIVGITHLAHKTFHKKTPESPSEAPESSVS